MAAGLLLGGVVWLTARDRKYRGYLKYNPRKNYETGVAGPSVRKIVVPCTRRGFLVPELSGKPASAFLEMQIHSSPLGRFADPAIDLAVGNFCDKQYFERGVSGTRHLNVSRLTSSADTGSEVHLRGRRISWPEQLAEMHLCDERPRIDDRVVVVAPHPDDAEIAAFGLYSDTNASVLTITAGNASGRYPDEARLRVWDSLTVPQVGGIKPSHAINLCYPDGQLAGMYANPKWIPGGEGRATDFASLRQMNICPLVRHRLVMTWHSLVDDLAQLLEEIKPSVIATPHPWLDSHADHRFTTVAVCEAILALGRSRGRFYFYVVHNRSTELWPFGAAGSGVPLPPLLAEDLVDCDGFYSHALSPQQQRQKFIALEAMHDLREIPVPAASFRTHLSRIRTEARAALHGMGVSPTSYLRRAVRPDELFFTTSFHRGIQLCEKVLRRPLGAGLTVDASGMHSSTRA